MGTIHAYTAEKMDEILEEVIQSAAVVGGHLIITLYGGGTVDLGDIRGPQGIQGPGGTITSVNGKTGSAVVLDLATAIAAGTILLASNAEAQAGADAAKAITPASLASVTATTGRRGLIELATDAEIVTGTDVDRTVSVAQHSRAFHKVQTLRITATGITAFTKATYPWLRAIRVVCIGAGGGGGGAALGAASQVAIGGSGGGGAYAESWITDIASLATSVDMTVGVGGTAGASGAPATAGGAGGASSFGALVVAGGGAGGANGVSIAVPAAIAAADGGVASAGDIQIPGEPAVGFANTVSTICQQQIPGVAIVQSVRGKVQAAAPATGVAGSSSSGFGAGAIGAANGAAGATKAGAAGQPGLVIVELYA